MKCVTTHYAGPAETVGQVGHLPYHFLVVHTGNDVAMIFIRDYDSEVGKLRSQSRKLRPPMYWYTVNMCARMRVL